MSQNILMRSVYFSANKDLNSAAWLGNVEAIRAALVRGADLECRNAGFGSSTALIAACEGGHTHAVRYLLLCGANSNPPACHGTSPLHCAARYGHESIVQLLLQNCANIYAKDDFGITAKMEARKKRHSKVVVILEEWERVDREEKKATAERIKAEEKRAKEDKLKKDKEDKVKNAKKFSVSSLVGRVKVPIYRFK